MHQADADVKRRWKYLKHLAAWSPGEVAGKRDEKAA
jgi:hypothetical protein